MDVFTFDGTRIEQIARLTDLPAFTSVRSAGLLAWRDEILLWCINTAGTSQEIRMLLGPPGSQGAHAIDFAPITATNSSYSAVYSLGGDLIVVAKSGSDEGFYHTSGLQDGYVVTSKLDFGSPGRLKRLNRITALVSDNYGDAYTDIRIKTDDDSSWTALATFQDNSNRIAVDSSIQFYTLQVRVDLDDDSETNLDYGIDAISIVYSIDTGTRRSLGSPG